MIYINGLAVNTTIFPDNTSQVWKIPSATYPRYVQVVWRYSHEGEVMQLAQLKALLDEEGISADLDIKYLPYARQDKEISNDSCFALKVFADILNRMKFERVAIQDPHSQKALDLIKKSYPYYPYIELEKAFRSAECDLVIYPDAGANEKYANLFNYPCTSATKVRDQLTGNITHSELTEPELIKNKAVMIVDDICDGGRTFIELAKLLKEAGACRVDLFVTHGLFSKGLKPLKQGGITNVFTPFGLVRESDFQKGI